MRNDNKNDYDVVRRDSKISCYGTTGKVIINVKQSDTVVPEPGGHYASTTTVYPDIWVILGDVNQSGRPVYQNVAHEKLLE